MSDNPEAKHICVALALIIKDGQLLMGKRNDPVQPEFHNTWEFPGGGVEFGETIEAAVLREAREEVGYEVEIVKRLNYIGVFWVDKPEFRYQVYLVPHVCRIVGGDGKLQDSEVLEARWFDLEKVLDMPLLANNGEMYRAILPELKQVVATLHT